MRQTAVAFLTAALMMVSAMRPAVANPYLARAKRALDAFKERKALRLLRKAARWKRNTRPLYARIHLYRGVVYFNMFKRKKARRSLRRALLMDPAVALPDSVSPKIRRLFNRIRASLPAAKRPTPPLPTPKTDPHTDPTIEPETPPAPPRSTPSPPDGAASTAPPDVSDDRTAGVAEMKSRPINWPAWLVLGLAAAAGGAGLGMGLSANAAADDGADKATPWFAAEVHHTNAKDRALVANILFGVAGAAAITSVVLFLTGGSDEPGQRAAVLQPAVLPVRSGFVLQLGGATW